MKPVIICGGIGTKMWPESRKSLPKHFLPLLNGKSLFELNWEALRTRFSPEEIFLQTTEHQAEIAKKQAPEIRSENIFIEPEARNQGPATGFAAAQLYKRFPDEPFMLVQVDVLRQPTASFIQMIEGFDALIRKEGKIVTGGLKPTYAVMGVDYLIVNPETKGMEKWLGRGTKEEIEAYLSEGKALIHTNHYAWTPRLLLECFKERRSEWYEPLMNIVNGADVPTEYAKMPKGPIEEITKFELETGYVWELPFEWIDFGTWESVAKYLIERGMYRPDESVIEIDSNNNMIRKPKNKTVALIGVSDLAVVDTEDALLICRKDQTGRVGEVVDLLKEKGKIELL